jgi:hypothetical protein
MRPVIEFLREGEALLQAHKWQEAAKIFDAVLSKQPKIAEAANGLGIAHHHLGNIGSAIAAFSHATLVAQEHPDVWANFGATLRFAGHIEWGRAAYERALKVAPNHAGALNGMCGSYVNEGNPAEGVRWGERAVAAPDAPLPAHLNLALCLMELGRWDEAWPHWRRRVVPGCVERHYPGDRWRGEDVDWLIVHGEQGLGDEVMFLGCLPELMDRAHRGVVIEVNPRLVPLVRQSFPQATVIGRAEDYRHPGDGVIAHVALGDLPELCAGGIPPKRSGYLRAPGGLLSTDAVLLAMRGGTMQTHDYLRNPPVDAWRPVVEAIRAMGLRPVSIQYGPEGPGMAAALGIEHDADAAGDLTRQAEAIAAAVALVSVQQTALHLGGAVGAHVLGIVSNKPAWRYGITGDMPWYETVDLYRQAADENDWAPVMGRVVDAVARLRVECAA